MKIVVCVKVVPVSDSVITIGPDNKSIVTNNLKFDLNPYDEYAIEAAVQLKEQKGGEVVALSIGPSRDSLNLKRALALGADRLIHLVVDDKPLCDPVAIASGLANAIKPLSPDLVFCGKISIDSGNGLVGPLLARQLCWPCITGICELNLDSDHLIAAKDTDFGQVVYKSYLPCLLTTEKGLNKPRFPSLKDIMLARKKESVSENTTVAEGSLELLGLFSPEPRPAGAILGKDIGAVPELIRRLIEEAKVL